MLARYQIKAALFERHYAFIGDEFDMRDAMALVDLHPNSDFIAKRSTDQIRYIRRALEAEARLPKYVVDELRAMLAEMVL